VQFDLNFKVAGDVRVAFFHKGFLNKKVKMFQFWFNTSFFDSLNKVVIDKFMLDGAHKV
jgi:hypothetical protein